MAMHKTHNRFGDHRGDFYAVDAAAGIRAQSVRGERLLLWLILLCLVNFVVWAYFAKLDEVIRGQGKVIPSSQLQVIQNLEGGIIKEIRVAEGDRVRKGDVLIVIDDTRFESSLLENRLRLAGLQAKAIRLRSEADGASELPDFPTEIVTANPEIPLREEQLFTQRAEELKIQQRVLAKQVTQKQQAIPELEAKRKRLKRSYSLTEQELRVTRPLRDQGAVSEVEVLRLERQVNDLRGELEETTLTIPRAEAELAEFHEREQELLARFRKEARAELNEVMAEVNALTAGDSALEDRVQRTQVRSPIRGIVKKLAINTEGGVVQPGMDLVEIVPVDATLLVEARVKPRDIAFLRPSLPATVKLTAFDFSIYGGLAAQVEHISADTFTDEKDEPYYLVRVRTDQSVMVTGSQVQPILPGMTAEVDILVGEKTVLAYLLKPVLRARAMALQEP